MNRRSLLVGALAVFTSTATEAIAKPKQELPDYIRVEARDYLEFGLHNIDLRIHRMEQDACIQMSYDFLIDIEESYTIDLSTLVTIIEQQHPELNISMVDEDGLNEEVRLWIEVKPGAHFKTIRFDPAPNQESGMTLKLPNGNVR